MRLIVPFAFIALAGANACGASQASPAYPGVSELPGEEGTLPRYFSVVVSPSGLEAVGQEVDELQLREAARREALDPGLQGAAVTAEAGVSEERAVQVLQLLVHAGFKHVVFSSRDGLLLSDTPDGVTSVPPGSTSSDDDAETAGTAQEEFGATDVAQPAPPVDAAPLEPVGSEVVPVPQNVEVKQMGLHVGGGPNDDATHARYSNPIMRRFDDFKRCYPLAQGATKNASFGVDLLISQRGGKAKIKDYRTVLGGKEFHLCVLGVFGSIDFPAPEKATVVSYSVLFKPL